jgi:hypothetical protein
MSESKFTPGPWHYKQSGLSCFVDGRVRPGVLQEVAWCGATEVPEQMEANARLIAAAPELLEALQELLREAVVLSAEYLETFRDWPNDVAIQGWDKARWTGALAASEKAKSAIAKATGA